MLQPCAINSFNPDSFPFLQQGSLLRELQRNEGFACGHMSLVSDKDSMIRQASGMRHCDYRANGGVTVFG